ncbi:MAG: hypothetical protein Q4G04_06685 [bacterium]|nr:hypothetical protein [bacterium]
MKNKKVVNKDEILKDIKDQDAVNKIIDLCLWYQMEDSHRWMEMIDLQIKNCNLQIEFLLDNKPFWFQKKKLDEHNKKIDELENKIADYYKQIEEVEMIEKMQRAIKSDEIKE